MRKDFLLFVFVIPFISIYATQITKTLVFNVHQKSNTPISVKI